MKWTKIYLALLSSLFLVSFNLEQSDLIEKAKPSIIWEGDTAWAKTKLASMSLDEKLGQLFMVAAYSNKGKAHTDQILSLVKKEHIGGLIFFQGGPGRQAKLTNMYQQAAKVPLMIAMDAEWGLAMRLDSTFKFPWPMTLGAMQDTAMAYQMGAEIAKHCQRLGVHINFAPVVDINTNPDNPIINARSFGEDRERVSLMSEAYMRGMQDQRVLACAKHFPGHGDTDKDSHKTLPTVGHPFSRLDKIELYPYKHLMEKGLGSVMAAHLNVPAMDNSGMPSSLSYPIIQKFLKDSLGFDGLVFTDALNMGGVSNRFKPGEVDLRAFMAGNDVLLFSQDVNTAKARIKEALEKGKISQAELDRRVYKILVAKHWLGLKQKKYVEPGQIVKDINPESSAIVNRRIYEQAITVLTNKEKLIPISKLEGIRIACVTAGKDAGSEFPKTLKYYANVNHFHINSMSETQLLNQLAQYDLVIMGIYTSNANPWKSYKVSPEIKRFVKKLSFQNKMILNLFANPYALQNFAEASLADALMVSYQNHKDAESLSAQIIFGALGAKGRLPVQANGLFEAGFGLNTPHLNRMGYALPGEVGLNKDELSKVELLVKEAIQKKATPGCQLLVARHGKVVYQKAFGHHTYMKGQKVSEFDLYDIASITKIMASVPMLMELVEEKRIDLDKTLGYYMPELKGTNKENMVIRDILTHQARLKPWIPFYLETLNKNGNFQEEYYSNQRNFNYPNVVADQLFSSRYAKDTIMKRIYDSPLLPTKKYKYSDLGYYLFMALIERIEGKPLNELVNEHFYSSIGAYRMTYRPTQKFNSQYIVPTETDRAFRKQTVDGYVHDQGAALIGGVAGHAGLFSNANDLAKMMQMYLNGGNYGGRAYFDSITVNEFARCQYCEEDNRRGIGFDKPQLEGEGPTCGCVSPLSFGHTGFTGTMAWADPEQGIVYIFLSNRVHPNADNRKLLSLSTRTRIQKVIYNSIQHDHEKSTAELISTVRP